jgi:hypothetical protein
METETPQVLPAANQIELKIWAENGKVRMLLPTGHWMELPPRSARLFAAEINAKAEEAEGRRIWSPS